MSAPISPKELKSIMAAAMPKVIAVHDRLVAEGPGAAGCQIVLSNHSGAWEAYGPSLAAAAELARNCESPEWADEYCAAVRACGADARRVLVVRGGRAAHCRIRVVALTAGGRA